MLTVWIEQCHRHRRSSMMGHHLDEFARVEVALYIVGRDLDEAEAGKAAGDISFGTEDLPGFPNSRLASFYAAISGSYEIAFLSPQASQQDQSGENRRDPDDVIPGEMFAQPPDRKHRRTQRAAV